MKDSPMYLVEPPSDEDHALKFEDGLLISLELIGVTSYFSNRSSTQEEVNSFNDLEFGELQDGLVDK